jgi:large subunit ribosomal protein L25
MPTPLIAITGRQTGSPSSRRLRSENKIPGVVYGHGMTPLAVSVDRRDLRIAVSGAAGTNTVLDLTVDGPDGKTVYPAIIKDLQRHPVRRTVTHIDFLQVNLDEEITVSVPLRLEGEATEVLNNNGLVDPAVDAIEVVTTPRNIPAEFVIDVSEMTMDTVVRLGDVPMPAGVTATGDPDSPVVTVLTMRAEIEEIEAADAELAEEQHEAAEGEEAGEAAEEGEAAAAAEGEGAAGDDDAAE